MGDRLSGLGALFGKCRKLVLGISTVFVGAGLLWQMEVIPPGGSRGTPRIPASRERAGAGSLGHPASSETREMEATEERGAGGTAPPDAASDVAVLASSAAQEISPKEPPEDRARMKPAATESVGPLREETRKDPDRAEPSEVVPRAESAGSSTGPFSVHVNSHASWRAAEEEVARLLRAGYRAFAVPAHRNRVRVLVGSFGTKAEAAKRAEEIGFLLACPDDGGLPSGLPANVKTVVGTAPEAMDGVYERAHVALVLYHEIPGSHWGFYASPLKLYEALAAGVPVIGSDLGQISETIGNVDCGRVVDGCPDAIAAALRELASDPARASEMSGRARLRAEARGWREAAVNVVEFCTQAGSPN